MVKQQQPKTIKMTTALKTRKKVKQKPSRSTFSSAPPKKKIEPVQEGPIRIDLGCGKNKRKDGNWIGVDVIDFEGVDIVMDLSKEKWPWKDGTVDEVHASHFVEHLEPLERVHFVNELYRVLKNPTYNNAGQVESGFARVIVPHWASQRAYGDLTHKWPAVSEFWFYYLSKEWRAVNAPHNQFYTCDLETSWGYGLHDALNGRNQEYVQNAMQFYKEACTDIIATMIRKQYPNG